MFVKRKRGCSACGLSKWSMQTDHDLYKANERSAKDVVSGKRRVPPWARPQSSLHHSPVLVSLLLLSLSPLDLALDESDEESAESSSTGVAGKSRGASLRTEGSALLLPSVDFLFLVESSFPASSSDSTSRILVSGSGAGAVDTCVDSLLRNCATLVGVKKPVPNVASACLAVSV